MSADLERLGTVLSRELAAGAEDALVDGGLDELLRVVTSSRALPSSE